MTYSSAMKYVLHGKESTWGTAVAATKDIGLIIQDVTTSIEREVTETNGISDIKTQKITTGVLSVSNSLSGDFQHGRGFEYVFGSVAHALTTSDTKHTFTIANNAPSCTLETGNDLTTDTTLTNAGMMIESAEFTVALNANFKVTYDFKGKTTTSSATGQAAVLSTLAVFPHALCSVKIGGSAATEVQNASISVKKTLSRSGGVSSNLYQQSHVTELKISFKATLGFQNKTYQELVLGGTTPSATGDPAVTTFELTGNNGVTLGSGRREFRIYLDNCTFSKFDEKTSVGGLTFIDVEGVGLLNECFTVDNIASASW